MINYKLVISKRAKKMLDTLDEKENNRLIEKIFEIADFLNGKTPDLDIKRLKGKWKDFYRLRVGKVRVIFNVELDNNTITIYNIGSRGDVYK